MSLRKSPKRTPGFLAANRANGRKFNGARRLSRSRQRELLRGLRDGGRLERSLEALARAPLPQQLDFARLYASLHKAVAPEPGEVDLVLAAAAFVWRVKQRMENRVRSPRFKAQVAQDGRLPPAWHMPLQRPGGQVTVTIWVRPGRTGQASGAGAPAHFCVGLTIRRNGRRPWQPSDGPRNSVVPRPSPDTTLSAADVPSGQNEAVLHLDGVENDVGKKECNRNSSDKVTVPFVKRDKNALQAGMSKFVNKMRSYVQGLTRKTEDAE